MAKALIQGLKNFDARPLERNRSEKCEARHSVKRSVFLSNYLVSAINFLNNSKPMYSNEFKCKYLQFLDIIKDKSVKIYNQKEIAIRLEISQKTFHEFWHGRIIRFDILEQVAAMSGFELEFNFYTINHD